MEQVEKFNKALFDFVKEFSDVLSINIFDGIVLTPKDRGKFFQFIDELQFFSMMIPYRTEILNKYSKAAICSYKIDSDEEGRILSCFCQKNKRSYFALILSLCEISGELRPHIRVDIYSDNPVVDCAEFVEDNKEFEDYSLIENSNKLGL